MKRKALFVGINAYNDTEIANLRFALYDAVALYGQFTGLGFESKFLVDQETTREKILKSFKTFTGDLEPGDVFFFFFAGHGYSKIGTDEQLLVARDDDWEIIRDGGGGGVPCSYLRRKLETRGCHSIFVLDACRSNILANTRGARDFIPSGPKKECLVGQPEQGGTMVALRSCRPGRLAHEIPELEHGLYTAALLDVLKDHRTRGADLVFNDALNDAVAERMGVLAAASGISEEQTPEFVKSGLGRDLPCVWSLGGITAGGRASTPGSPPTVFPGIHIGTPASAPQSKPAPKPVSEPAMPLYRVIDLATGSVTPFPAVPPGGWTDEYKTSKLVLRRIDPGTFLMGSPTGEEGRFDDEKQHRVTLTKPYYMGVFEVTQGQWERIMGSNLAEFKSPTRPVECVRYDDIRGKVKGSNWPNSGSVDSDSFLGRLRAKTGQGGFDLPTEAQWEYACRAGTTTALPNGKDLRIIGAKNGPALDDIAWYGGNSGVDFELSNGYDSSDWAEKQYNHSRAGTHPVGMKRPNAWGLYDMIGNVWEWCADWYGSSYGGDAIDPKGPASGTFRVYRGGSWFYYARFCRSASRYWSSPGNRYGSLGFRLACSAGPSE